MRTRWLLPIGGLLATMAFCIANVPSVGEAFTAVKSGVLSTAWILAIAVPVHLLGHVFRVHRTKIVIDEVNRGSFRGQFAALSAGFLINTVVPLRLGELLRSFVIARTLQVSFFYTFTAIAIERLIDLGFLGFVVLIAGVIIGPNGALILPASLAIAASLVSLSIFVFLIREQRFAFTAIARASAWFNPQIQNRIRFRVWSAIYGYQRLLKQPHKITAYLALGAASWACYIGSVALIAWVTLSLLDTTTLFVASTAPYIATTSWFTPTGFEAFAQALVPVLGSRAPASWLPFALLSWVLLVVPISLLGLAALWFINIKWHPTAQSASKAGLSNKLRNFEDVSQELPRFLDGYFRGAGLSPILHRIEVQGSLNFVRFFRGGSNAVIALALAENILFVKKIVRREDAAQLHRQKQWLERYSTMSSTVRLLREDAGDGDYYGLDLEYLEESGPFFGYAHRAPLLTVVGQLERLWDDLDRNVYLVQPVRDHFIERDEYVRDRVEQRVHDAAALYAPLERARGAEHIKINGTRYLNFDGALERIRSHPLAWADLASYAESASHGDLTIDNLLVNHQSNDLIVIDPSDDNQITGRVIDVGRLKQSLHFGYEFMLADDTNVVLIDEVGELSMNYADARSYRYELLEANIDRLAASALTPAECRATSFHAAAFFGRMLTHRVMTDPLTCLKYYGQCVIGLNQFLAIYDDMSTAK